METRPAGALAGVAIRDPGRDKRRENGVEWCTGLGMKSMAALAHLIVVALA